MATSNKIGLFQGLPTWAKGIIALATVGVTGIIVYTVYKKVQRALDKGKDDTPKETADLANKDYTDLVKTGQVLSFTPSAYAAASETIVKLLDGCETSGSEQAAIAEVIKVVKKPVDWYYLIKIFGQKDISDCGSFGFSKTRYSLVGLLKDQLDSTVVVTPTTKLGGWTVPNGFYSNSIDILSKYLSGIGIKTF